MKRYNPKEVEPKWQQRWIDSKIYEAEDNSDMPKKYILEYFPYPSGVAMHVGHVRNYAIGDAIARFNRMRGYNVLHPMGWDAFGLPAENYAIKTKTSPQKAIAENTARFKEQLVQMGFGYDWSREFTSSDPDYYKWTQWFFLLLHKRGLAYRKESLQWWCPIDKTVLANEQVEEGKCWRCGSVVEKKALPQWFFKITDYADRLVADLDDVDWTDSIRSMQRNWIGRSQGAEIIFKVADSDNELTVFTTRPDTLYGATFMVVAPEHPIVSKITTDAQRQEVGEYIKQTQAKSDVERQETDREKTGVFTGAYAINPVNNERIPVWIADYVLAGYGTGAIMAVPAHDERDHEFAKKFDIPMRAVVTTVFRDYDSNRTDRNTAVVVAHDPKEDRYCMIHWRDGHAYYEEGPAWPGGGVNDGESLEEAALREFQEETGYTDVTIDNILPAATSTYYDDDYTGDRRVVRSVALATVHSMERGQEFTGEDYEKDGYDVLWLTKDEVLARTDPKYEWRTIAEYALDEAIHVGEGVLVNSGPYNNMRTEEAREKIVADLEKRGTGKIRVNYKIRDWLISRQRYWGAPIPIVHCANCVPDEIKSKAKFEIDFVDAENFKKLFDGSKTAVTRARDDNKKPEFASINQGDIVKLTHRESGQKVFARILSKQFYRNLKELYDDTNTLKRSFAKEFQSEQELAAQYEMNRPGYVETINKQGAWAWHIEIIKTSVAVPEDQLPVVLPGVKTYEPSGDGRSPLARVLEFVNTQCPKCGGPAQRETDTMDGFACSSWYFLRFADPHNSQKAFGPEKVKYWLPVDDYIGGAEHAVMHLLYARMWTKVMQDEGLIDFGEPFKTLRNHGMILAPDGQKMSKSKGNTIEPDSLIDQGYGADAIRIMELFIGPWNQMANWSVEGMGGAFRFLQRTWAISQGYMDRGEDTEATDDIELKRTIHRAIHRVSKDLEGLGFNTAVAGLMETVNELYKLKTTVRFEQVPQTWEWAIATLLQLLAPFAPHITEELWEQLGKDGSIHTSEWPVQDERYLLSDTMVIVVQVNGKVRAQLEVATDAAKEQILETAKKNERVAAYLEGNELKKSIYVPGKLVNFVV